MAWAMDTAERTWRTFAAFLDGTVAEVRGWYRVLVQRPQPMWVRRMTSHAAGAAAATLPARLVQLPPQACLLLCSRLCCSRFRRCWRVLGKASSHGVPPPALPGQVLWRQASVEHFTDACGGVIWCLAAQPLSDIKPGKAAARGRE